MATHKEIAIHSLKRSLLNKYGSYIDMSDVGGSKDKKELCKVSRCIAAFAINIHNPSLDKDICANSVCDGSDDNCIDAIYVNHEKKQITVVQSKFDSSGTGSIKRDEIIAYFNSCKDILLEKYELFGDRFKRSCSDLNRAYDESYKYIFVYAYSGRDELTAEVNKIIDDRKDEFNFDIGEGSTEIVILSLSKLRDYLSRSSLKIIDMNDVEVLQYGVIESPLQAIHGVLTGDQIAQWWEEFRDLLLEKNIRGGLGEDSDVNQSIRGTIIDSPELFYYYNNGITVLVDDFKARRRNNLSRRESGGFDFKNMSVINGAQTISTIGNAYLSGVVDKEHLSSLKVSCRFIKSIMDMDENEHEETGPDISLAITIANNKQNKVTSRDFASRDDFQIDLKKSISFEEPYVYEIKRSDNNADKSPYHINMDDCLSALVCASNSIRNIGLLKSNRGRFFESTSSPLYKSVFNSSVSSILVINSVNFYKYCFNILSDLEKKVLVKKRQKIIIHGRYMFIALVMEKYRNIVNSGVITAVENYPDVFDYIDHLINTAECYINRNYPTSHIPRYFENQQKIKEIYVCLGLIDTK